MNEAAPPPKVLLTSEDSGPPPVIVDLGRISRKKAKKLKKGQGVYLDEVLPAAERVRASLGKSNGDAGLPIVVVLYEKKAKKVKSLFRL